MVSVPKTRAHISFKILRSYIKVVNVVLSCRTLDQLNSASTYIKLWKKTLPVAIEKLQKNIEELFFIQYRRLNEAYLGNKKC